MPQDSSNPPVLPKSSSAHAVADSSVADLKLVDETIGFEGRTDEEGFRTDSSDTVTDASTSRSLPIWMFVLGLIAAVVVIGWQAQLAGELEAEIAGLEGKLERSNALLEAHRSHLGDIRGGVHDLSERLDRLSTLVDEGPETGGAESALGSLGSRPTP